MVVGIDDFSLGTFSIEQEKCQHIQNTAQRQQQETDENGGRRIRDEVQHPRRSGEIAKAGGVSTATISRVNRALNYGADGYVRVLDALEEKGLIPQAASRETEEP